MNVKALAPASLLIADSQKLLAQALSTVLETMQVFRDIGVATRDSQVINLSLTARPDVCLIDTRLPDRGGFEVASEITRRVKGCSVVFMAAEMSELDIFRAVRMNCAGYILKNCSLVDFAEMLRRVAKGTPAFSDDILKHIERDPKTGHLKFRGRSKLVSLTSRQYAVLRLLAIGLSVKEISSRLHLSSKAVDSQKYRIMKHLNVHSRVELTRLAIRERLIDP